MVAVLRLRVTSNVSSCFRKRAAGSQRQQRGRYCWRGSIPDVLLCAPNSHRTRCAMLGRASWLDEVVGELVPTWKEESAGGKLKSRGLTTADLQSMYTVSSGLNDADSSLPPAAATMRPEDSKASHTRRPSSRGDCVWPVTSARMSEPRARLPCIARRSRSVAASSSRSPITGASRIVVVIGFVITGSRLSLELSVGPRRRALTAISMFFARC